MGKVRRLSDVTVHEVSVVDRAANKKTFFMTKALEDEMNELLKKIMAGTFSAADEKLVTDMLAKAEKMTDEEREMMKVALKVLNALKGKLPTAETEKVIQALAGIEAGGAEDPNYQTPEQKAAAEAAKKAASANLDPKAKEVFDAMLKAHNDELAKANARAEKSDAAANEALKIAKAERDARVTADYITKAKEFRGIPIAAAKFGPMLKAIAEALPEVYTELEKMLKAMSNAVVKGGDALMKEIGAAGDGEGGDVLSKIEAKAEELCKADSKLTKIEARALAWKQSPDLVKAFRAEQDKVTANADDGDED